MESFPFRIVAFIILNNTVYWLLATGPTVVYVNEILPTHSRELGVGLANAVPIGIAIALGQEWPVATARIGPWSYLILLATCTCGTALCWFFIKEPKGLSIERIDVVSLLAPRPNDDRTKCLLLMAGQIAVRRE